MEINEQETEEGCYNRLKGSLMSLAIDTAAKAYLLNDLDYMHHSLRSLSERLQDSQEQLRNALPVPEKATALRNPTASTRSVSVSTASTSTASDTGESGNAYNAEQLSSEKETLHD